MSPEQPASKAWFTISFRYSTTKRSETMVRAIESVASGFGFRRVSLHAESRQIITCEMLRHARKYLSSSLGRDERRFLRATSTSLKHRLTRNVHITTVVMKKPTSSDTFTIEYCGRNWFPYFGIDLWVRTRPSLPAGFITVQVDSVTLSKRIRATLRQHLHHGKENSVNEPNRTSDG